MTLFTKSYAQTLPLTDTLKQSAQTDSSFANVNKIGKDSLKVSAKKPSGGKIDAPIDYDAKDSIRFEVNEQKMYLYGDAKIVYKEVILTAEYIELDLATSIVFASGVTDSTGKEKGKPNFKDGNEEFQSKSLTYNYNTKRGIINGVVTKQSEGYLHSEITKRQKNEEICIKNGKYTTCDQEHPHFYIGLSKAKVIPNDKIVSGPAYLVVEDIPMPLAVPFGYFPNKSGHKSGILMPSAYGNDENRGIYMREAGYYFAICDYFDLAVKGDIYTKLDWALGMETNYKLRYKFTGNFFAKYEEVRVGEPEDVEHFFRTTTYWIKWRHDQDPKARPNSSFSANVDLGSSQYHKYSSELKPDNYLTNTTQSNISYRKTFANTPFGFSINATHNQNKIEKKVSVSLPLLNVTMNRIFPLKRKVSVGESRWYEKIGISYNSTFQNTLTTTEDRLFTDTALQMFNNGVRHTIPISTSFNAFKFFTITPSGTYNERWYWKSVDITGLNDTTNLPVIDTVKGFKRSYDFILATSLSTKLYGMYTFKNLPVKAIRHILTPSVSYSYRPDFSEKMWGSYKSYIDTGGAEVRYSIFEGGPNAWNGIYGSPPKGKSGLVNFSLSNNLEMKVRNRKDSVNLEKKIILIENLTLSVSYNIAADSLNWSKIAISGRTRLFRRLDVSYFATLDPYVQVYDKSGVLVTVNDYEWDVNRRIARLTNTNWALSMNLDLSDKLYTKTGNTASGVADGQSADGYRQFRLPWTLFIGYTLTNASTYIYSYYRERDFVKNDLIQTITFTGEINLTPKWRINIRSDYDFVNKQLAHANVEIHRDLHCWEMSFIWIPVGFRKSYNFQINVKAAALKDLKLKKQSNWADNY